MHFETEMETIKRASRFKKIDGQVPSRKKLKVSWACLT